MRNFRGRSWPGLVVGDFRSPRGLSRGGGIGVIGQFVIDCRLTFSVDLGRPL